ncbi:MAG: EAL domain-containing protein [Methylococcales bacterium]|jgi:diguanylate cyclase (GGDEF)-like protein/PAS domain S-box-containing protein|nr:EAL domain-containing protein [Methylococcales bacterium]MBT7444529.1 EAL domain-containing protein [Methylococcales bacterium]
MSQHSPNLAGAKVMLVDDNPGNINLLREILEPDQYSLYFAIDGEKAIAVANKVVPDLILLDVMMPGIDGFETCEMLKKSDVTKNIPVIFVTAKTEIQDLEKGFQVGAIDYIHKPVQAIEVQARVRTHLELQNSKKTLAAEKQKAQITLLSIGDGVITTDAHGKVEQMNQEAETLTGWNHKEAQGLSIRDIFCVSNNTQTLIDNPALTCLSKQTSLFADTDVILHPKSSKPIAIEYTVSLIQDDQSIIGSITVFHDVTLARQLMEQMDYQAKHDPLTGLINRNQFERIVQHALQEAKKNSDEHLLFYMDLDQFKVVNDTCGHIAGDELLRQVTGILRNLMRQDDTLARLGGDEFGVLLTNCSLTAAYRVANSMLEALREYRFVWEDKNFIIGVSIGIAMVTNQTESIEKLLSRADNACYAAKDAGRNCIHFFADDDEGLLKREGEMEWVSHITTAFSEDRMVLQAQVIKAIQQPNDKLHFEALIRMRDVEGNLIPPGAFLPSAERFSLMPTIDRWVVRTMFSWLGNHPEFLQRVETCAINLSGHTLCDDYFPQFVEDQFKLNNLSPNHICFEITETSAIANLFKANAFINTLRDKGCRFSLDDFGSGLSSYSYLKNLPVDYIKIDGFFVRDIATDPIDYILVKSINEVGHAMGKHTVAEFVETDEAQEMLRSIGVDYAQGYGIAKPMDLTELLKFHF